MASSRQHKEEEHCGPCPGFGQARRGSRGHCHSFIVPSVLFRLLLVHKTRTRTGRKMLSMGCHISQSTSDIHQLRSPTAITTHHNPPPSRILPSPHPVPLRVASSRLLRSPLSSHRTPAAVCRDGYRAAWSPCRMWCRVLGARLPGRADARVLSMVVLPVVVKICVTQTSQTCWRS